MYYCITFILSNPCFVLLYLQLAAKLATAAGNRAYSGDDSDDGTADVVEVLAGTSSMSTSTPRPTSCPPDTSSSPPPPHMKKKASSFPPAAGIRERNIDSHKLQQRIETLLEEKDTSRNCRVQFGLYLTSMIPRVHESLLVDYMEEAQRLILQYVRKTDMILLQDMQQQQQQQQQQHHKQQRHPPPHPPLQQPFVAHDMMQFQQPQPYQPQTYQPHGFQPRLQVPPKYQHIPFHQSFPVQSMQPVTISEIRPVVSQQRVVTSLPANICSVTTASSSIASSSATSTGGLFDPIVPMTMASLDDLQPPTPMTPSTSFISDENVNLNTPQPGGPSDEG